MSDMYDSITGRAPIATDDLGYIGTGKNVDQVYTGGFTPTAQQLEAMNSGINTVKVQKLDSLATIKSIGTGLSLNSTTGQLTATGTGGTTDYTDLENKPTINNVTVTGDLSLSDLGINIPAASDTDPQMNGTASAGNATEYARANHVHPTDTSRQAALTAEQLTAVNSGITAADVEQIATNTSNILTVADSGGQKNILEYNVASIKTYNSGSGWIWNDNTVTNGGVSFTINSDGTITVSNTATGLAYIRLAKDVTIPTGTYVLSGCPSGGSTSTYRLYTDGIANGWEDVGNSATKSFATDTTAQWVTIAINSGTSTNFTFKPMICTKSQWDVSHTYQPYALSNAELTAAIQAIQAQLANT